MSTGFPLDLVLFGMIAAFLVLRLRGILGRRAGFERNAPPERAAPAGPVIDGRAEAAPERPLPATGSELGLTLARMRAADGAFDPARFLAGAEAAFRMIVAAFAAGDRVTLRSLLSDETYRSFETAITRREEAGETQRSEVRAVQTAAIEGAALAGMAARIEVRFVSDQVAETLGKDGKPVAGTDAVTEITDLWTFERQLGQPDPAWRLAAAKSG